MCIRDSITSDVDLMPKVDVEDSLKKGYSLDAESEFPDRFIKPEHIDILDWNRIYFAMLDTKVQKKWYNFVFGQEDLKEIIRKGLYRLKCPEYFITPNQFEQVRLVEDVTIAILRKYLQKYYDKKRNLWIRDHLFYRMHHGMQVLPEL